MSIDARRDVLERRILAQGTTPEEWAVEVAQPVEGVWTTMFYVGVRGFKIAGDRGNEGEGHCMFIGRMFVRALRALIELETEKLSAVIVRANDQLFDSHVQDPQHQVDDHADTLPVVFIKLAAGHDAALETLQTVIREWVDPETFGDVAEGVTPREMLETGGDPAADLASAMTEESES
jgi:hypothetical protein